LILRKYSHSFSEDKDPQVTLLFAAKKIYRLKEDQAFSLSLELGRREKFAWHPSADILLHSTNTNTHQQNLRIRNLRINEKKFADSHISEICGFAIAD
jgi:hypothetical protein